MMCESFAPTLLKSLLSGAGSPLHTVSFESPGWGFAGWSLHVFLQAQGLFFKGLLLFCEQFYAIIVSQLCQASLIQKESEKEMKGPLI